MEPTQEVFESAVNVVRNMPKEGPFKPSDELKLKFYAFYKQATHGSNDTPKPRFYDVVNIYKWNAWKKLGAMPKDEAKLAYINELKDIIKSMPLNEDDTNRFNDILRPFCQYNKDLSSLTAKQQPASSSPSYSDGHVRGKFINGHNLNSNHNENLINGNGHSVEHNHLNIDSNRINGCGSNGNGLNSIASWAVGSTNNGTSKPRPNAQSSNLTYTGSSNNFDSDSDSEFCDTYTYNHDPQSSMSDYTSNSMHVASDPRPMVTTLRGGYDGSNPSPHQAHSDHQQVASGEEHYGRVTRIRGSNDSNLPGMVPSSGDSGGDGGRNNNIYSAVAQEISDQLALAVLRLQYSMEHTIQRLDSIEARIACAEKRQSSDIGAARSKPKSTNRATTIFYLTWPILVYFIFRAIEKRQRNQSK